MNDILHITSGDVAGSLLAKAGIPGDVVVWHDILYDGPRTPGWPTEQTLQNRSLFLEDGTGGGLDHVHILATLREQYRRLADAHTCEHIVLWFDACLFDQSMLAHVLTCLRHQRVDRVELICVGVFPGIEPFHGLGQLRPDQLAGLYSGRRLVTDAQFAFAARVDEAFAKQDGAAVAAIRAGWETPDDVYRAVAGGETPQQFWGDTTLWATINTLAARVPPLVRIHGPADRLPQWPGAVPLSSFRITATEREPLKGGRPT